MKIGIVGLGLIGGSLGSVLKKKGHIVYGRDKDKTIEDFALMAGTIDHIIDRENIEECRCIFIAVTPEAGIEWLEENAPKISKDCLVMDTCGTKRLICEKGFSLAKEYGFKFVGGHPMAGKQIGGLKNASKELFEGAFFALVPEDGNDIRLLTKVKTLLQEAGFKDFAVMTPEDHDRIIAFTSQMAHLISNAYVKSEVADLGVGVALSGGAFRDMTRVAYLDQNMWTQLFMENKDNLLKELDGFIGELRKYKDAIERDDKETLTELLLEGKKRKEEEDARKCKK